MRFIFSIIITLFLSGISIGQYQFTHVKDIECTSVKNQQRTGTCWSFSTASFIESELLRQGKENLNLSEMYVVRNIYKDKARNYMLRQGKANFSQGSLAHDLLRVVAKDGIVPENVYSGRLSKDAPHDHSEMERGLKGFLDGVMKRSPISSRWPVAFEGILDSYLGEVPEYFEYKGKSYDPQSFAAYLGINTDDFVNITSFSHHPYNESFILEIPDNYSNGEFYNMPLDELVANIDHALNNGYSIAWDGDVSEKGFSQNNGIAILPKDLQREDLWEQPGLEIEVNQENRQLNFENYQTTDDHLMHLVGMARDQKGGKYYIVKNSWGEVGPHNGYLYMSEAYLRMKTVSVTFHQDGLIKKIEY